MNTRRGFLKILGLASASAPIAAVVASTPKPAEAKPVNRGGHSHIGTTHSSGAHTHTFYTSPVGYHTHPELLSAHPVMWAE